ncbi:membrane protein FxsA [Metabacillus sp. GX 13764]|uniref:FxsA family protein n=1 Tax=Metabacillus kandeliae TaxID=2900151 RepID=UPI001E4D964A|nr:FxsA family protein [Metabacillus kandeliae]MCD7032796.1 membrane protein FxsA [Metabacillus kandeliae]
MRYLLILLILIPAIEIGLFIYSGKHIGVLPTVLLIILTGIIGAWLAKKQGIETIKKAREQWSSGMIPSDAILDGLCILAGAVLLVTPGFISDLVGFVLLLPFTRRWVKPFIMKLMNRQLRKKKYTIIR